MPKNIRMLIFIFLFFVMANGRCRWHSPESMFPQRLVHLDLDETRFIPRRRLKKAIYQISDKEDAVVNTITGASAEKGSGIARHKNAVPGSAQYIKKEFSNGLDDEGTAHYSLVFDPQYAVPDVIYRYIAAEPAALYKNVTLKNNLGKIVLAQFDHRLAAALQYVDMIKVWISVSPTCLPDYEIGRTPYDFNVSATYDLYHGFKNNLVDNATIIYTNRGWISEASIIMHPALHAVIEQPDNYISSPCMAAWVDSSLRVFNTSQFTYYDVDTDKYFVNTTFIGNKTHSIPRCHRRSQGNVCFVQAKARLNYINCEIPVAFSVSQAVSQIARYTRTTFRTPKPNNFNASRREPVPDHDDRRYDMCESRVCENTDVCSQFFIENQQLMKDGQIGISQEASIGSGYIETTCNFEVIGFLDDIWSPHIYFRQWVGYNYTLL